MRNIVTHKFQFFPGKKLILWILTKIVTLLSIWAELPASSLFFLKCMKAAPHVFSFCLHSRRAVRSLFLHLPPPLTSSTPPLMSSCKTCRHYRLLRRKRVEVKAVIKRTSSFATRTPRRQIPAPDFLLRLFFLRRFFYAVVGFFCSPSCRQLCRDFRIFCASVGRVRAFARVGRGRALFGDVANISLIMRVLDLVGWQIWVALTFSRVTSNITKQRSPNIGHRLLYPSVDVVGIQTLPTSKHSTQRWDTLYTCIPFKLST